MNENMTPELNDGKRHASAKKKSMIQLPVIISLCIVLLALIGYFVYSAFFLREPDGKLFWSDTVIWKQSLTTEDGTKLTMYYQFDGDGKFKATIGTAEINGTYEKITNEKGEKILAVSQDVYPSVVNPYLNDFRGFHAGYSATYTVSGSRILGNQKMTVKYSDEIKFDLKQVDSIKDPIEKPKNFKAKKELVGTWIANLPSEKRVITINKDGTMSIEDVYSENETIKTNGTYTYTDDELSFTYYLIENINYPFSYKLDGDYLTFDGYVFTREGSGAEPATPDQYLMLQQ